MVQLVALLFGGVGLFLTAVGLLAIYTGYGWGEEATRITEMETTAAGEVAPGTVKVKGTARPTGDGNTVPAPTTEGEALAAEVQVVKNPQATSRDSETVFERREAVPFVVEDETGEVRVEPPADDSGTFGFTRNVEYAREDRGEDPSPEMQQYLDRVPTDREFSEREGEHVKNWRFDESTVEPGDDVVVTGEAREATADWDGEFLVDGEADPERFAVTNETEDGITSSGRFGMVALYVVGGVLVLFGLVTIVASLGIVLT